MTGPATAVLGSSAGGSETVRRALASLPTEAPVRVLVVQHMLEGFTGRFAERLNDSSRYEVRESGFEDSVGPGEALVARGDLNMVAVDDIDGRLKVEHTNTTDPDGPRPSIDAALSSVAEVAKGDVVAVLLSGMGSDGVRGVEKVRREGGMVVAQDEETSDVFGMPRRAIESGNVDRVVPGDRVADAVVDVLNRGIR